MKINIINLYNFSLYLYNFKVFMLLKKFGIFWVICIFIYRARFLEEKLKLFFDFNYYFEFIKFLNLVIESNYCFGNFNYNFDLYTRILIYNFKKYFNFLLLSG